MNEAVLDANVVLKWLRPEEEPREPAAALLRAAHDAGELRVSAPALLPYEVLNVVGRKWRVDAAALTELATWFGALRFDLVEPPLDAVARWTAAGLSAYDAAYVAVAESAGVELITADRGIVAAAPGIARALADVGG